MGAGLCSSQEAEAGRPQAPAQPRQLDDLARPCLKIISKRAGVQLSGEHQPGEPLGLLKFPHRVASVQAKVQLQPLSFPTGGHRTHDPCAELRPQPIVILRRGPAKLPGLGWNLGSSFLPSPRMRITRTTPWSLLPNSVVHRLRLQRGFRRPAGRQPRCPWAQRGHGCTRRPTLTTYAGLH